MNDTIEISLPERLLITRQRAKCSRRVMARLLDVGPGTIGNWEKGRVDPDYRSLVAWCFALGIPLSDLGVEKIVCSFDTAEIDAA
jgi:transcriptional regulator with XRE-family HTH domain